MNHKKKRVSVVIVDDNEMMRSILRGILRSDIFEIVGEASNGNTAVEVVQRLKPQIVFLDIMMPEKDGLSALDEIKVAVPKSLIIMISSTADIETVRSAIQRGASGYVIKPFNAQKVLETLQTAISRSNKPATPPAG